MKKVSRLTSAVILICNFVNVLNAATSRQIDHLAPIPLNRDPTYRKLLTEKLNVTSFTSGRITIKPSFEGESSISIYCDAATPNAKCYVTRVVADQNLWQETNGGNMPERAAFVKVHRVDTEISREVASALEQAFLTMLSETRAHSSRDERALPIDATSVEFALQRRSGHDLAAQVNPFLPRQGKRVKKLIDLAQQLEAYCDAAPDKRPSLLVRINTGARQLVLSAQN